MQIAHLQSDIAQIISEILRRAFRQRRYQNALTLFDPLAAKLDGVIDLTLERLERDFWIEKSCGPDDLFDHEGRTWCVGVELLGWLIGSGN